MIKQVAALPYARRVWQIVRHSPLIAIGGVNGIMLVVSVAMSLITVRVLPKEDYGHLVYFYAGFGMLRLLMNFGLGMNISRDVAAQVRQPERLRVIVYSSVALRFIATGTVLVALGVLAAATSQPYLEYIAAAAFFASLADLIFSLITGLRITRAIGLMTAVQPISYAVMIFALTVIRQTRSEIFMLAYVVSFVLMLALGVVLVVRSGQIPAPDRQSLRLSYIFPALGFAIPVYLGTLTSQGWSSFTGGILGWRGEFEQAAEFGVAFNLISMVISISAPTLVTTFFPQVSHLFGLGNMPRLMNYIRSTFTVLIYGFIFIAVALLSFPETIVSLLFSDAYRTSAAYLMVVAPVVIFMGVTPIFTLTQIAIGRPWWSVFGLAVQLVVMMVIVLTGGAFIDPMRLSWATLISTLVGLLMQVVLLSRHLKFNFLPAGLPQMLIIALIAVIMLRALQTTIGVDLSIWHFVLGGAFTGVYWFGVMRTGDWSWLKSAT